MKWYKQRVWQLGIGAILVLSGSIISYLGWAGGSGAGVLWTGLIVIWAGLAIPLVEKLVNALQERQGEEGES